MGNNVKLKWEKRPAPTWHEVVDTNGFDPIPLILPDVYGRVQAIGYDLFTWNGKVYELIEDKCYDTGWTSDDLNKEKE